MIRKILNHSLAFALFALAVPTAMQAQSGRVSASDEPPSNAKLKRECDGGSLSSCGMLGQRYQDDGNASPEDMKKGFALFKRACDGGDTIGCGDLAQSYLYGKGVAVDEWRAFVLSWRTCNDGNMIGCALLGIIHQEGRAGYPKNPAKALRYYREACNESQPRWDFPCKRADGLAGFAAPPADHATVESRPAAPPSPTPSTIGPRSYDEAMTDFLFNYQVKTGALHGVFQMNELPVFCHLFAKGSPEFANMMYKINLDNHLRRIFSRNAEFDWAIDSVKTKVSTASDLKLKLISLTCPLIYPTIYPADEEIEAFERESGLQAPRL